MTGRLDTVTFVKWLTYDAKQWCWKYTILNMLMILEEGDATCQRLSVSQQVFITNTFLNHIDKNIHKRLHM